MNYEKLYKDALERAKTIHNEHRAQCADIMMKVFPELAESEDDRIKKELIRYLPYCDDISKDTKERWIAWLEKQGEQKQSWNERDEKKLNTIINVIHGGTHLAYENEIDWLKSLKYRIKGE